MLLPVSFSQTNNIQWQNSFLAAMPSWQAFAAERPHQRPSRAAYNQHPRMAKTQNHKPATKDTFNPHGLTSKSTFWTKVSTMLQGTFRSGMRGRWRNLQDVIRQYCDEALPKQGESKRLHGEYGGDYMTICIALP